MKPPQRPPARRPAGARKPKAEPPVQPPPLPAPPEPIQAPRRPATRIIRAVKTHDWFSVSIELAIVVVGILIAFQVSNWGEDWKAARQEQVYLARLEEETAANVAALARNYAEHTRFADQIPVIERAFSDAAARQLATTKDDFGCGMFRLPAVRLGTPVSQELIVGDRMDILRDRRLRDLIRDSLGERAFVDGQTPYFRDVFLSLGEDLNPYFAWRIDPHTGAFGCSIDLDRLAGDPLARSSMAKVYRDQKTFLRYRQSQLEGEQALLERVRCLRARNCRD